MGMRSKMFFIDAITGEFVNSVEAGRPEKKRYCYEIEKRNAIYKVFRYDRPMDGNPLGDLGEFKAKSYKEALSLALKKEANK